MSTEHLRFEHIKVDWNLVYVFYNEKKTQIYRLYTAIYFDVNWQLSQFAFQLKIFSIILGVN